jgi:hypothetical protein
MQRIQDFRREKNDTPRTMYTRLVRFARESGGVFAESQLVKVKIDKRLLDLALPRIIMEFGGRATLVEAFTMVEQCDHPLCQHDAIDLVSLLVDSSKLRRAPLTTTGLAEAEAENIYHCWSCGQACHAKKNCPSKQRQAQAVGTPKRKPFVPAQGSAKKAGNQLPKQLKCSNCGRNNHAVENCFVLHPEKCPTSEWKKTMEAKIGALEERFKSLALSGQILDSPSTSGTKASSSTPDYYMFGASGQVVSSAAVTRAQTVSRATPSTTGESMDNLRARNNGPADQIGQACLPLSFGLADAAQSVNGHNSSL